MSSGKHIEVKSLSRVQKQEMSSHTPRDVVERRLKNLQHILDSKNFEKIVNTEFSKYQNNNQISVDGVREIMHKTFKELDHPIEVTIEHLQNIFDRYDLSQSGFLNKSEFSSFFMDFILYIQMMTESILNLKNLLESFSSNGSHNELLKSLQQKVFPQLSESEHSSISIHQIDKNILKSEIEELFMSLGTLISVKESDLSHCLVKYEKKGFIKVEDLHLLIQEVICRLIESTRESLYNMEF